jgi:predicted enzyme related to lactoylglutathione lyase
MAHSTKGKFMSLALYHVTVDCNDVLAVANFWSTALDRPIDPDASPFFASIGRAEAEQTTAMFFQKVDEGKVGKNRMHLDLHADDRETEVLRLVALGAKRQDEKDEWGTRWTIMMDPEGNEFCVA